MTNIQLICYRNPQKTCSNITGENELIEMQTILGIVYYSLTNDIDRVDTCALHCEESNRKTQKQFTMGPNPI